MTYKTWRKTNNPWQNNNFIGYLNPNNTDDIQLINEIHNIIDDYFEPRILGIENGDRFLTLFKGRLAGIEPNFFNSFKLDKNYSELIDMLRNIDMLANTKTDTDLHGTNTSTINTTRTDNLKSTKSSRDDESTSNNIVNTDIGNRHDSTTIDNTGTSQNKTDYGRVDTQSGTDTTTNNGNATNQSRGVNSQTPQSNLGSVNVGIDAPLNWDYASAVQDSKTTQNNDSTSSVEHGLKDTLSGSDTNTTTNNLKTVQATDTGEQNNKQVQDVTNTYTEGEQSVSNTGTQDTQETENRTHQQIGDYNKDYLNQGRNENIAILWKEWRDLLHKTITSYMYLFENMETLFMALWDVEDDCWFKIV